MRKLADWTGGVLLGAFVLSFTLPPEWLPQWCNWFWMWNGGGVPGCFW